jgi:DNA-binding response OmpR family regulator
MLEIIGRRMSGPGKACAIQPVEARPRVFAEHPNKPLQRDWLLEVTAHRAMEPFDRAIDLRINYPSAPQDRI